MNIIKLVILIPVMFVLCVMLGGEHWYIVMALAFIGGSVYFRWEQDQKKRQIQAIENVEVTRKAMISANVELEQARVRAEQLAIDEARAKEAGADYLKGQMN